MRPFVSLHVSRPGQEKTTCIGTTSDPRYVAVIARVVTGHLLAKLADVEDLTTFFEPDEDEVAEVVGG